MKNGFTLIEMVIVMTMLGIGLMTILQLMNYSVDYVDRIRQEVIAINLAREGVESVIARRNSNRQRRAGTRDACRLKQTTLTDAGTPGCIDDQRLTSGNYLLILSGGRPAQITGKTNNILNLDNGADPGDYYFSLCNTTGTRAACPNTVDNTTAFGRFFRMIRIQGLYSKHPTISGGVELDCPTGNTAGCGDTTAKELRFCSIVEYTKQLRGKIELCSVITNFTP